MGIRSVEASERERDAMMRDENLSEVQHTVCDVAVATLLLLDCISVVARMLCRRHGHIACRRALVPVVCGVHGRRRRGCVSERLALRADRDTGRRLTLYRRARSRHRVTSSHAMSR